MVRDKKNKGFHSFSDFITNSGMEFEKTVETVVRKDENMANNRLFVWNFEAADLEEMVDLFEIYKGEAIGESSRQKLNSALLRKMNNMLREGFNPIECMLYASKVINHKLLNDKLVQDILAERIRDVYIKREAETIDILKNIMEMWTWIPQLRIVIVSIGLIGENEELLDLVSLNYGEDESLKDRAFHAFMQNKSLSNLERALKIIANLQNTEDDQIMGRRFMKEVSGFGWEGMKIIEKYNDHPAMSRAGRAVIKKIMIKNGTMVEDVNDDGMYREALATKSSKDDMAFKDFMEDCREKQDRRACFLCRFSRADAGQFLKEVLENSGELDAAARNDALISLAIIGQKGYHQAAAIIKHAYQEDDDNYAPIIAEVILGDRSAGKKMVDIWCEKKEFELFSLFGILRTSNFRFYDESLKEFQGILDTRFRELVEKKDFYALEILTGNLEILWDKKLYFILSMDLLKYMQKLLTEYANGERNELPEAIVISMINTVVHSWSGSVETAIFQLFHNSENPRVQQMSYKILQAREVQAPK